MNVVWAYFHAVGFYLLYLHWFKKGVGVAVAPSFVNIKNATSDSVPLETVFSSFGQVLTQDQNAKNSLLNC